MPLEKEWKKKTKAFLKKVMDLNQDEELARYYMDIINNKPSTNNEGKSTANILMLSLSFDGGHLTRMGVGEAIAWIIGQKLEEESDLKIISSFSLEAETKSMGIGFHRLSDSITAMNMGKAAKVDYVIYGSYKIYESTIEVDIRVVNVKTTEIVTIEHQKASGEKKINDLAEIVARKIRSKIEQ
jgi:TolB-like protein